MSNTESFESVMDTLLNGFTHDVLTDELSGSYKMIAARLDRLKAAHDREIRDTAQQQYDRGFHAGQHSMDAEHRAVAMRLRQLPLDGGSHENLSQIARAIYHADFGWTHGACASLRDELVRLMGGVSDDTCDSQCRGACAADCGRDSGKHEEVGHGGTAHDCADDSRGGSRGKLVHMDGLEPTATVTGDGLTITSEDGDELRIVKDDILLNGKSIVKETIDDFLGLTATYDVLDNERRKAIAELRKMTIDSDYHGNYQRIALAIGTVYDGESFASECVRDRLIHLLGGDQPSGIDVLREMDGDGVCPNDAPTSSITEELRECVYTATKTYDDTPWHEMDGDSDADHTICYVTEGELLRIADRIDEQFERICQQQEAVLQATIDGAAQRLKDADKRLDDAAHDVEIWRDRSEDMCMERDEMKRQYAKLCVERADLLDLLRDARDEYVRLRTENQIMLEDMRRRQAKLDEFEKFDADTSLAAFGDDNDKLRRLLSRAAKLLEIAEHDRDTNYAYWMDCKEKVVHANITIEELQAKLDAIRDSLDG